mgnify:CR=1 FL=1
MNDRIFELENVRYAYRGQVALDGVSPFALEGEGARAPFGEGGIGGALADELGAALEAGLTGYTYLSDEPLG